MSKQAEFIKEFVRWIERRKNDISIPFDFDSLYKSIEYLDETVPTYGYSREQMKEAFIAGSLHESKLSKGDLSRTDDGAFEDFMATISAPQQEAKRGITINGKGDPQQEQDGWVSVKDKLPEYGKYLTYNGNAIGYAWYDSKRGWYDKSTPEDWEILFYHLLPPPPKQ